MIGKQEIQQAVQACVQDEPPACTAACPLHVDARAVLADAARGNWSQALATLSRAVPFPGTVARLCPQPCRPACVRGEVGDPVRIADLERACAEFGGPAPAPAALPRRRQRVAVVGGGLTGVTAALDLARRAYAVELHEAGPELGGTLRHLPEQALPRHVVDGELAAVAAAGAVLRLGHRVTAEEFERLSDEADAVLVATGAGGAAFGLAGEGAPLRPDPVSGATERDGVFAGGQLCRRDAAWVLTSVADGRRAAISIDRWLQGVSLTAARTAGGSATTCLFTSTENVDAEAAVAMTDPTAGYTRQQAAAEAARCLQCSCLECVKACTFLEHYGSYPTMYARRILHNVMMIKGDHTANRLINSCSLCGLCAEVCPTGVDMGALLKRVRQRMVQQRAMPPSAHDFALRDLEFSNGEACALARAEPGKQECRYAFFPGCQLAGSAPQQVSRTFDYLRTTLGDVGLILRCCGAPADWAGRTEIFQATLADFDEQYHRLGSPTLILPCTSCQEVFRTNRPDIPVLSLWSVLDRYGLPDGTVAAPPGSVLSIHDPCTSRYEPGIQEDVRRVLTRLGYQIEELPHSRRTTECCSYGGLVWLANREVAEKTVRRRLAQSPRDYLTYCVMCRDLFAARGKRTLHLLDLLCGQDVDARAARPGPGITQRHENRARLTRDLLATVWGEHMEEPSGWQLLPLRFSAQVARVMEDRLILVEDLQRVIDQAERTGERLLDRRSGHWLARYRPREVTYWAEYTRDGEEFVIHRAYSHRLQVIERDHREQQ